MDYQFADINEVVKKALFSLKPPPNLSVSEWADRYRRLSKESSAKPGRYRTSVTEYMREPMEMIGKRGVQRVVLMCSAQVAKSTVIENTVGYYAHIDPSSILHISPNLDSAKMFSKERLSPMIRDTPVLRGLFRKPRGRDSGNTLAVKQFAGGFIAMVGANSPAGLASRPIRVLVVDELDRFEASAGTEGDPLTLAVKRTTAFANRTIVIVSTPGDKSTSRINREFERGDMRYRWAKCPHCDEMQILKWAQVKWENADPDTAHYVCEHNGCVWDDKDRVQAGVRDGEWRASKPWNGTVSYHLNQLYSPFARLSDGVREFLDAKGDNQLLKAWVNTFLGETWEDKGKRLEWSFLKDNCHDYETRDPIPEEITVITGAVDVQDDRFEIERVGWGENYKSWSLSYDVIYGDLSTQEPWQRLREMLKESFVHPLFGEMVPRVTCVDSGGSFTSSVYSFCEHMSNVVAIKGMSGFGKPVVGRPLKNTIGGHRVFPLGVDNIKETVVSRLQVTDPDKPGYCAFPMNEQYGDEYFRGLTAEELRERKHKGFIKKEWHKIRRRNEPFDLRVYGTAALEMLSIDLGAHRRLLLQRARPRDNSETVDKKPVLSKYKRVQKSWTDGWRHG